MSSQGFDGVAGLDDEVARYAAEVRGQLADLPAEASAELLEDLEDHLREVAAEDTGVLRERLGSPAEYARELRQAAGLPAPGAGPAAASAAPGGGWRVLRHSVTGAVRGLVRRTERRIRSTDAGGQILDFLPSLRPAWWVLRAWVLVRALEVWTGQVDLWRDYSLIPKVGDSRMIGFVALLLAIPASVYVGRRTFAGGWRRRLVLTGEAALGVFAAGIMLFGISHQSRDDYGTHPVSYVQGFAAQPGLSENGQPIRNLFVYDQNGKLVDGALVYDQDGRPVTIDRPGSADVSYSVGGDVDGAAWVDATGQIITNRYPRQLIQPQWSNSDNAVRYVTVPPPSVNLPQGLHQLAAPTPAPQTSAPQTSATPGAPSASSDSPSPSAPATTATGAPGGATEAHGSPTPSVRPSTPATPGAPG